jgi:hypothetical protein
VLRCVSAGVLRAFTICRHSSTSSSCLGVARFRGSNCRQRLRKSLKVSLQR